eukprot:9020753-Pyramimonas_sp.AAC.1
MRSPALRGWRADEYMERRTQTLDVGITDLAQLGFAKGALLLVNKSIGRGDIHQMRRSTFLGVAWESARVMPSKARQCKAMPRNVKQRLHCSVLPYS